MSVFRGVMMLAISAGLTCGIALAGDLPAALSGFRSVTDKPVFTGRPGQWDELIRERGWVMKDGDTWRMWYTGYNKSVQPYDMKLGYATSADGLDWTRQTDGPIHDDVWVEDMIVIRHGDLLYMFAEGAGDQAQLLTSSDGLKWTRVGSLDVRLQNGSPISAGPYGTPTVWVEDGTWYLFYERRDQGIWLATSTDARVWTNVSDRPLIVPGPDSYDALMIAMNQIVKIGNRYYAVMHGTGTTTKPRDWCTYFCVSDDLRTWKKCAEGPVLPVADNKSSGVLVQTAAGFRLYTMHAAVHVHETAE
ncbi:MAG: glycosylase [Planctomycetaceae bacterium]|nr:glycosylase [Planctomycetaceae bacterium]